MLQPNRWPPGFWPRELAWFIFVFGLMVGIFLGGLWLWR